MPPPVNDTINLLSNGWNMLVGSRRPQVYDEFRDYTKLWTIQGETCDGEKQNYVPREKMREFWRTGDRLEQVFSTLSPNQQPNYTTVSRDYTLILSILVELVDKGYPVDHIRSFTQKGIKDFRLPLTQQDLQCIDSHEFSLAFHKTQWKFCPAILTSDEWHERDLQRDMILPITFQKDLTDIGVGASKVRLVSVNSHSGGSFDRTGKSRIVFKTYADDEFCSFQKEYSALNWVANQQDNVLTSDSDFAEHIIRCYGSFSWITKDNEKSRTLMVEYAPHGTLHDMFQMNETPVEFDEIQAFWENALGILKGLAFLDPAITPARVRGVHQDLKSSNILLCAGRSNKPFDRTFKLADFDHSNLKRLEDPAIVDVGATKTYSHPDMIHDPFVRSQITPEVDAWAASCLLLEMAVWVVSTETGRKRFQQQRREEFESKSAAAWVDSGYHDCFHNGQSELLQCVRYVPKMIERTRRVCDTITLDIVQCLLDNVLLARREARLIARQLLSKLQQIVIPTEIALAVRQRELHAVTAAKLESERRNTVGHIRTDHSGQSISSNRPQLVVMESSPPVLGGHQESLKLRPRTPTRPRSTESQNDLYLSPTTMSDGASNFSSRRQSGEHDNARVSTDQPCLNGDSRLVTTETHLPPALPIDKVYKWARDRKLEKLKPVYDNLEVLKDRDIWIIFDNSTSMQCHKEDILKHGWLLAHLFKRQDNDGIDVCFTSQPATPYTCKTGTECKNLLNDVFSQSGSCVVEMLLNKIVDDIIQKHEETEDHTRSLFNRYKRSNKRRKKTSIFFLTDGVWDCNEPFETNAEVPIQRLVKYMHDHSMERTDVSLHLVRYGNAPLGIKRLSYLDDNIKYDGPEDYDIVDHISKDEDFSSIIVGPLNKANDRRATLTGTEAKSYARMMHRA